MPRAVAPRVAVAPLPHTPGELGLTIEDIGLDPKIEAALGLAWLARQQKADGSWQFDQGSQEKAVAATGLALLPFLGAGETHKAKDKEKEGEKADGRKYTKTVAAGVGYLMKQCPVNG